MIRPPVSDCPTHGSAPHSRRLGCLVCRRATKPRKEVSRGKAPKRTSRPRQKRKGDTAAKRRLAESLARAVCLKRSFECAYCGAHGSRVQLDAAHCLPKSVYPSVRYDPANLLPLCREDHDYFTPRPVEWRVWFVQRIGVEQYEALLKRAARPMPPLPEVISGLEALL